MIGQNRKFTLVEILVVIAIIAILAALLMPALESALESANQASCAKNLKSIFLTSCMYSDDWDGNFPGARGPGWQVSLSQYTDKPCASLSSIGFLNSIFDCPKTYGWSYMSGDQCLYYNYGMNYRSAPDTYNNWAIQIITPVRVARLKSPSKVRYIGDATADILDSGTWYWSARHMKDELGNLLVYDGHVECINTLIYSAFPVK